MYEVHSLQFPTVYPPISRVARTQYAVFFHAEPVKPPPPPPLHLRLPAAVAELAVYVFCEHHRGAVLLFSAHTLIFLQPNSPTFVTL